VNFALNIWRQEGPEAEGRFERFEVSEVDPDASFLEMLDVLNERLIQDGERVIAFDSDCREGICGACSLQIDGVPHGPKQVTTCQVFMREFPDGAELTVEPFRSSVFTVIRDLITDRTALDRIIEAGGYISVTSGPKPEPNSHPVHPEIQTEAMNAAICIGCGACVAACPNGAAQLFTAAKVSHLALLPQGQPERYRRVLAMIDQADAEGFGSCSNEGECEAVCPKDIPISNIARMTREYVRALWVTGR
jgi:succinate dehydrogenase / fumarate reductase iron-sulfur subunit